MMSKYNIGQVVYFIHIRRDEILKQKVVCIVITEDSITYTLAEYSIHLDECDLYEDFEDAKDALILSLNKRHNHRIDKVCAMTDVSYNI